eukprot:1027016-Pyramimonas_sp.AAC.1
MVESTELLTTMPSPMAMSSSARALNALCSLNQSPFFSSALRYRAERTAAGTSTPHATNMSHLRRRTVRRRRTAFSRDARQTGSRRILARAGSRQRPNVSPEAP